MTSKKSKSKKTSAKKSTTKKRSTKKSGAKKASSAKTGAKKAGSTKTATSRKAAKPTAGTGTATKNPSMPPAELFDPYEGPAPDGAFEGADVAEPWQETQSNLPDLMARSITASLDARNETVAQPHAMDAFAADLDTDAATAGSPTWRAFQASAKQPEGIVGRSLAWVWNMLVALLGAPPPNRK